VTVPDDGPVVAGSAAQRSARAARRVLAAALGAFLVVLVLVRLGWTPLATVDATVVRDAEAAARDEPWLISAATWVSRIGSGPVDLALVTLLAVVLAARGLPRAALTALLTMTGGMALNVLVKELVGRQRPLLEDPVVVAAGHAFPSGHTMNATICYALLAGAVLFSGLVPPSRRRTLLVALLVAVPLLVGSSRVVLDVHYVSDVLGGWTLGLAWVLLVAALTRGWRRREREAWAGRDERGTAGADKPVQPPPSPGDHS
jgi:undecaprenyl-diphosphatase